MKTYIVNFYEDEFSCVHSHEFTVEKEEDLYSVTQKYVTEILDPQGYEVVGGKWSEKKDTDWLDEI